MITDSLIKEAFRVSQKSNVERAKLSAFVFSGKNILVKASNASFFGSEDRWTIHAEEFAILKANRLRIFNRYDNVSLAVFRFNNFGDRRSSKPCDNCSQMLQKFGVKRVYFFDALGNVLEEKI